MSEIIVKFEGSMPQHTMKHTCVGAQQNTFDIRKNSGEKIMLECTYCHAVYTLWQTEDFWHLKISQKKEPKVKHALTISGLYTNLAELGKDVALMRYDKVVDFLKGFRGDLERQSQSDQRRGRVRLAAALRNTVSALGPVIQQLEQTWRISEPHLRNEEQDNR